MKTVLITGGSRGIGSALVKAFSAKGYRVAFTYKNSIDAASELANQTSSLAIRADSANPGEILNAVETVRSHYGKIDCLINNAAISGFSLFTDITLDDWNDFISTNLTGPFLYTQAVLPDMISQKYGRIINLSSIWGLVGSSCEVHYSTTKAGLIGMTKSLAKELGPSGITVNAIAPGVIDTDMNREQLTSEDLRLLAEETPVMRMGTPDEIAAVALFLAGEDASFITGAVINVSGGFVV